MSVWIPPGHRTHDGQPDCDVRWCECSGRCTSNAPCDCCELAELRDEVERLTAELAERDRRIERTKRVERHLGNCPNPPDYEDWTPNELECWGAGIEYAREHLDRALREGEAV